MPVSLPASTLPDVDEGAHGRGLLEPHPRPGSDFDRAAVPRTAADAGCTFEELERSEPREGNFFVTLDGLRWGLEDCVHDLARRDAGIGLLGSDRHDQTGPVPGGKSSRARGWWTIPPFAGA